MMMKRLMFATVATLMAACQPMPSEPVFDPSAGPVDPSQCDVVVSFGSVCCGIDQDTRAKITEYVSADRRVTGSSERRWGREGEIDLCLVTRSGADADSLVRDLAAMVPPRAEGGSTGTTTIRRGR